MNGAAYGVEVADFTSAYVTATGAEALLTTLVSAFATDFGGPVLSSIATTEAGLPARDATLSSSGDIENVRLWFVGPRMYALLTEASPGLAVYPQHFFAEFALT
jgi:hypothetical protein